MTYVNVSTSWSARNRVGGRARSRTVRGGHNASSKPVDLSILSGPGTLDGRWSRVVGVRSGSTALNVRMAVGVGDAGIGVHDRSGSLGLLQGEHLVSWGCQFQGGALRARKAVHTAALMLLRSASTCDNWRPSICVLGRESADEFG